MILIEIWPYLAAALSVAVSLLSSAHIVLRKADVRAAIGWIGVVWLAPYLGSLLYVIFGINRIRRKATRLRPEPAHPRSLRRRRGSRLPAVAAAGGLADLVGTVTVLPLVAGNSVAPLMNGEEAYPAMLAAIDGAKRSVVLSTYIFDNDSVGRTFADALVAAVARGVEVRVLIDSVGGRYSFPRILSRLIRDGVKAAEFLHSFIPWRVAYLNLRNHRKILVIDGAIGFMGGMNIRRGHVLHQAPGGGIQDIQFRVEGPVVEHLMSIFAEDWAFATGELLAGDLWFPSLAEAGVTAARGVAGGPDEDYDKLKWVILGALAEAKRSVRIVTPYFLPDEVMLAALKLKAMSGVEVDIVIPARGNLRLVEWASRAQLGQLIARGCRVWCTPEPFDHSKLFVVDSHWAFIGSANWDPRSLYLNFEFNLECYGQDLAVDIERIIARKIAGVAPMTLDQWRRRSLAVKLRDGVARMFSPYL